MFHRFIGMFFRKAWKYMQHLRDMSNYRYEQAKQCLTSAQMLIDAGDFKGAANRSYYAVFHAIRSVLALQKIDFGKHSAVIFLAKSENTLTRKWINKSVPRFFSPAGRQI